MDMREIIELLCSRGHRGSTTGNEQWAALRIKEMFHSAGLACELQEFNGHRTFGEKLVVHLLPAIFVSLLPLLYPGLAVISSIILLFFIISFVVESTWFVDVASRIFPKRSSVNVLAREEKSSAGKRILFVAHHDSQKEGAIFNPRFIDIMKRFSSTTSAITPLHITFLSIIGLLVTTTGFLIEPSGTFAVIHLVFHLTFLLWAFITCILVLEWALNHHYVPGANDNATGVALMLDLARSFSGNDGERTPEDLELWYLSTGCEETGLGGALDFIKMNKKILEAKPTRVICLDGLGYGKIHYFTADGILRTRPYDKKMIDLAGELTNEKFQEDRSFICRVFTDGLAFSMKGYPSITFGSLDDEKFIKNYHWHTDTPENVDHGAVREARDFLVSFVEKIMESD